MKKHRIDTWLARITALVLIILSLTFVVFVFNGIFHSSDRDFEIEKNDQLHQHNITINISGHEIATTSEEDDQLYFLETIYNADIFHNYGIKIVIVKVEATHRDKSKLIKYNISSGNIDNNFDIEEETGIIRVHQKLHYKQFPAYVRLTVSAFDGKSRASAQVLITIKLFNEKIPYFEESEIKLTIMEEEMIEGCIATVKAYDPDIEDKNSDQHITYFFKPDNYDSYLSIDNMTGCLKMKKPFDRELWCDDPVWNILAFGQDNADGRNPPENSLWISIPIIINFIDVNDNAPLLMDEIVIWHEKQPPGNITKLKAVDYDSEKNGAPFQFEIDATSLDVHIKERFYIIEDCLYAKVTFHQSEQENYEIPILITDSGTPRMSETSILIVNITS